MVMRIIKIYRKKKRRSFPTYCVSWFNIIVQSVSFQYEKSFAPDIYSSTLLPQHSRIMNNISGLLHDPYLYCILVLQLRLVEGSEYYRNTTVAHPQKSTKEKYFTLEASSTRDQPQS